MKKRIKLLAIIVVAALCFSACGSTSAADNNPAKEETVTVPQKEETAAPEPVNEETVKEYIRKQTEESYKEYRNTK